MCIALAIYMEARSESIAGKQAVSIVIQNRMKINNINACEVIAKPNQFTWYKKVGIKTNIPKEYYEIAKGSLNIPDFTNGATHFHAKSETPKWSRKLKLTYREGNHLFYKES